MRIEEIMTAETLSSLLIHIPRICVFDTDAHLMARGRIAGDAPDGDWPVLHLQGSVIP